MNGLFNNYISHYSSDQFDQLFAKRIDTLTQLKHTLVVKTQAVNATQEEAKTL